MSDSVGQINLDLILQTEDFNKSVEKTVNASKQNFKKMADVGTNTTDSLSQAFKKLGAVIAGAFAVKQFVGFAKSCIELGSNLSEVQNVVDTVFTNMNNKVNEFAKAASSAYGLSENTAKKYVSNFGAMAEAFGFTEEQAYSMGTTLTGLAGDVASFYNISDDAAYNKLKAVFSGETESLKELGIVMTQTALDQYALANGFGKTTAKMSEAEKTALRYSFIQDKLSKASGDFAKTQDSWANQTRILKLQTESFMASLGQGFINVLTPGLRLVNKFMEKLVSLGNAFSDITAKIMGVSETTTSISSSSDDVSSGFGNIAEGADDASKSIGGTQQALKDLNKYLMKFDEINKLGDDKSNGGETDPSSIDVGTGPSFVTSEIEHASTSTSGLNKAFESLFETLSKVKDLFMGGFWEGLNGANFDIIIDNIKSIKESLVDIFTNEEVINARNNYFNSLVEFIGKYVGSIAKVAISVGEAFTSGLKKYLDKNSGFIKKRLANIFNIKAEIVSQMGSFVASITDVFSSVLSTEGASTIISSLLEVFGNGFLGLKELTTGATRDVIRCITQPFIDNKEALTETLSGFLNGVAPIFEAIANVVTNTITKCLEVYDTYIRPAMNDIMEGLSRLFSVVLDGYNTYIAPIVNYIANDLVDLLTNYVQPLLGDAIEFIGKLINAISVLWKEVIEPCWEVISAYIFPVAGAAIKALWDIIKGVCENLFTQIRDVLDILNSVIDFLVHVFTLDWDAAWNDVGNIFTGLWNFICDTFMGIVKNIFNAFKGIGTYFGGIVDGIKNSFGTLKSWFGDLWNKIAEGATSAGKWIWNGLTSGFKAVIDGIKSAINWIISGFNKIAIDVPGWIPGIGGQRWGVNIPYLAQGGYVKANQPQLAVIGDNRHEGEIVSPESKITECVNRALENFKGNGGPESIELTINLGDETLAKKVIKIINDMTRQHGAIQLNL